MGSVSSIPQVVPAQLKAELDAGAPVFILDVRSEEAFLEWRVEGRRPAPTVNIPFTSLVEGLEPYAADLPRDREITIVCAKGQTALEAGELLAAAGYRVRNLAGGIRGWAALYEARPVVDTGGLQLVQFNRVSKRCLSYLVASGGEALVVDPGRHIERYTVAAQERGLTIVGVLDTHVHADHISGGPELAAKHQVPYYIADGDMEGSPLPYTQLQDGHRLQVGEAVIEVLAIHTPGHTPGSASLLVNGKYLLSGDTVFVQSVGRPDLGGMAKEWAHDLFETLYARLQGVGDDVLVLPAHYSTWEEVREDGLVAERLGRVRAENEAFHMAQEEQFVSYILGDLPVQPPSYGTMRLVNRGEVEADEDTAFELEVGANQCAAKHHHG